MIDYNAVMGERLERLNALFRRAETFQFEMDKLKNAFGLTSTENVHESPQEDYHQTLSVVDESDHHADVDDSLDDTNDAFNHIDIDDVIASMGVDFQR